jgi:hypothetical protein
LGGVSVVRERDPGAHQKAQEGVAPGIDLALIPPLVAPLPARERQCPRSFWIAMLAAM